VRNLSFPICLNPTALQVLSPRLLQALVFPEPHWVRVILEHLPSSRREQRSASAGNRQAANSKGMQGSPQRATPSPAYPSVPFWGWEHPSPHGVLRQLHPTCIRKATRHLRGTDQFCQYEVELRHILSRSMSCTSGRQSIFGKSPQRTRDREDFLAPHNCVRFRRR
jgi:hypothetical protein